MIGLPDGFFVVLHDQDRIAQIPQGFQGVQEPQVVPLVKADARFVQDIQDSHETGADLGGQPDPLPFAARKGCRSAIQGQVIQAHVYQKFQAVVDFLEDAAGDLALAGGQIQPVNQPRASLIDRLVTWWMFNPLILTARLSFFSRAPWQPGQGRKFMNRSSSSRMMAESVSRYRRSRLGMTPSKSRS